MDYTKIICKYCNTSLYLIYDYPILHSFKKTCKCNKCQVIIGYKTFVSGYLYFENNYYLHFSNFKGFNFWLINPKKLICNIDYSIYSLSLDQILIKLNKKHELYNLL